ncbi:MAG: Competence/damage-inducible protein A [uncultured Thiotrichaceae bacterium]|uniref:Competence/damage-inducible protein A n=1 Tax=uncultured Thiotrichaceae bacterium TaxID=298394 RepID=A0A6S6U7W1_9GAMM|nr:MAG: Competence/damage-inducible protein A [uncultured Thiotrichaceae bacterium]
MTLKCSGQVGLILIGNELLNGSRQDKHLQAVISMLKQRGLDLAWVRMLGDEPTLLIETFRQTMQTNDIVFSFGGIGATPDDLTRQCSAEAAGVRLLRHPQLTTLLEKQFGEEAYPQRIKMAELPDGATLIPNPINSVAGYKYLNHHFVPGFPSMAWPMVEWSLDTHYNRHFDNTPPVEQRWILRSVRESDLIPMMEELLAGFPAISLSSLPSTTQSSQIDFGLKGKQNAVDEAGAWFVKWLDKEQIDYTAAQLTG